MEYVYIADTNLFLECKRLEELHWGDLGDDPIAVVLTKPVIREIDKHKKSSGRTRRRALEISSRIREMLKSECMEVTIRNENPRVLLRIVSLVKPDPKLSDVLDYEHNDDRIVGIVAAMMKEADGIKAYFFTDDSVAASTAKSLDLPFRLIEDSWKRPPEETTEAKRIKELEKQLATYRAQEPLIVIRNAGEDGASPHVFRRVPVALSDQDVERMIGDLKTRLPMQEEFCTPASQALADGTEISFDPPDPEEIEKYKTEAYPSWIAKCRTTLERLHEDRVEHESTVMLVWGIKNEGTRPASQVRVTFEAEGRLMLRRVVKDENSEENDVSHALPDTKPMPRLPQPPLAPQVKRIMKQPARRATGLDISSLGVSVAALKKSNFERIARPLSVFSQLEASVLGVGGINNISRLAESASGDIRLFEENEKIRQSLNGVLFRSDVTTSAHTFDANSIHYIPQIQQRHEEEAFYFDDWSPDIPIRKGALTCDLFRHMMGEEIFEFEVIFPNDGDTRGAVLCTVHAENLTEPVSLRIPVSRMIAEFSLLDQAEEIVANCGQLARVVCKI